MSTSIYKNINIGNWSTSLEQGARQTELLSLDSNFHRVVWVYGSK